MATKNNIRSIRFSDELAELIDRQIGDTFTQKFENLVTKCVWELPKKKMELQNINEQIYNKRTQLGRMSTTAENYAKALREIEESLFRMSKALAEAQEYEKLGM